MDRARVSVVAGVDGSGRSHRLDTLAARASGPVVRIAPPVGAPPQPPPAGAGLLLVDDAHLLDPAALATLTAAARRDVPMAISRRPSIGSPELADLDAAVAAQGRVELLGPLPDADLAALVGRVAGRLPDAARLAEVRRACAGWPVVAAALAGVPPGTVPPDLIARVQRTLATAGDPAAAVARVLALRLDLPDGVLATAAGLPPAVARAATHDLYEGGLLDPDGERMVPAVADALLAGLTPAQRRGLHDAVAVALLDAGGDPVDAAGYLRAAGARNPRAARAYAAAGERLRFADPAAALGWFDAAADAGAAAAETSAGRAEAGALLGLPVAFDAPAGVDRGRTALAAGAAAAHGGRPYRAAEALLGAPAPGALLAVPALVAAGRPEDARRAAGGPGPAALRRLAEAALAVATPRDAVPLFIEAAEAMEAAPPAVVLPDTPHALGAIVAVVAADPASAEHLLAGALAAGVGGPLAATRHRLLLGWVRLRTGRYDTAAEEVRRLAGRPLPGRERLLRSALAAGLARRAGDVTRMRAAWDAVAAVLARRSVDIFQLEQVEELVVAAARLRQPAAVAPVLAGLQRMVGDLGDPPAWRVGLAWLRLHAAVATEDAAAATAAARDLDRTAPDGPRQRAQCAAGRLWAAALAGAVDAGAVEVAARDLADAGLPWEASRLAGQAAIRTGDPAAARRLLERARDLGETVRAGGAGHGEALAALSEREVEVARLVLAGRTHKEIGSQLYIAPKTVEHHVARIRTKVGAADRAEFLAALRDLLEPPP